MNYRNRYDYMMSIRDNNFNIEEYLNSLPENTTIINVSNKGITYLPDLSRFTELKELNCYFNELTSLPNLPKKLRILYCLDNKLTCLPELPENLALLHCANNNLTCLPELPKNLKSLECGGNKLTHLPILPLTLCHLSFIANKIEYWNMNILYRSADAYHGVTDEINITAIKKINEKSKIYIKFRELYFALKFKKQFRDLLWLRVRQPALLEKYHPKYLSDLKDEDDLDLYLENLG
jgi:Leucine-rich repeat (LRR) protein